MHFLTAHRNIQPAFIEAFPIMIISRSNREGEMEIPPQVEITHIYANLIRDVHFNSIVSFTGVHTVKAAVPIPFYLMERNNISRRVHINSRVYPAVSVVVERIELLILQYIRNQVFTTVTHHNVCIGHTHY